MRFPLQCKPVTWKPHGHHEKLKVTALWQTLHAASVKRKFKSFWDCYFKPTIWHNAPDALRVMLQETRSVPRAPSCFFFFKEKPTVVPLLLKPSSERQTKNTRASPAEPYFVLFGNKLFAGQLAISWMFTSRSWVETWARPGAMCKHGSQQLR